MILAKNNSRASFLYVQIAKDRNEWNSIVDRSPYSVLYHKYESYAFRETPLPLLIKERNHCFLFPLSTMRLFKTFRLATSPIFTHASLLPDSGEAISLIPEVLDKVTDFLREVKIDYLSTSAPTFWSRQYATVLDAWFQRRKASVQVVYAHMIRTENSTFEEIWRHRFKRRNREEIRKAEREGVSVIIIDTVDSMHTWIDDIYRCNVSTLARQGRWGAYPDSYKEVVLSELVRAKKLLGEHFNVYGAIYEGRLIAYLVVQDYNKLIYPTKAMSRTRFLGKNPNAVLVAHLVKQACERRFHWVEYGFDRVRRDGKIPSLYPGIQIWRRKFGFKEVPIPIYRLGLTRAGKAIQYLYSCREHLVTASVYVPGMIRCFLGKLYAPRRRKLYALMTV